MTTEAVGATGRRNVTLWPIRRTHADALDAARLLASADVRRRVTVRRQTVTFDAATPDEALRLLDQLRGPLGVARGRVGHPYASLHAVRRRLVSLAALDAALDAALALTDEPAGPDREEQP